MTTMRSLFTGLAFLALGQIASAQVVYVDDTAVGANDGTTWQDAFTDLRSALAASPKPS